MKRLSVFFIAALCYALPLKAFAVDWYCEDAFNGYRTMAYWGRAAIYIGNFYADSDVAEFLGLVDSQKRFLPDKDVASRFFQAFQKHLQGDLPYHDVELEGSNRRLSFYADHEKEFKDFYELDKAFLADEMARRRASYGEIPGCVTCSVLIANKAFPVLIYSECYVSAREDLTNDHKLEDKQINFSKPDAIKTVLSEIIDKHMQNMASELAAIRQCKE